MAFVELESISAAMDGPRSEFFGAGGSARNPESLYNRLDTANLTFDVSNNQILCSITAEGLIEHACVLKGLARGGPDKKFVGAYVTKHVAAGGPWPFAVEIGGAPAAPLHETSVVVAELLAGVFPLFTYRLGGLSVRQLALAPLDVARPERSPRAFIVAFEIRNDGAAPASGALIAPHGAVALAAAREPAGDGRRAFSLSAGQQTAVAYAIAVGASDEELSAAIEAIRRKPALQWLNDTWRYHAERMGELSIPPEPYYAESFTRMGELCRQSVVRLSDGRFGGGFWGSRFTGAEAWETPFVWLKDAYHAMLPMGMLHPRLCADAALWFLKYGAPDEPFGPGLRRLGKVARLNHSLGNSLAAFQLAGEYWRSTGDKDFFLAHPELLDGAKAIFDELLAGRQGEVFLFPSLYISDGPARGDWHTGSNVVAWDAFSKMARLAREVYGDAASADAWAAAAGKLREALLAHCVAGGAAGRRLVEGANADGTFIPGHDGEETDTTLMPFYGFCEQDDEALLNHAHLAFTAENPLYWPEMDGVWWTDDERFGATFPAWMTALAGAADEEELARQLARVRRLTDLDGSVWWWPYRAGATDQAAPTREPSGMKSAWAAGVYLCLFVNNVLGLRADRPARTVSFRPFGPWGEFAWRNCRLGESVFDAAWRGGEREASCEITNRNVEPYEGLVELMLPEGIETASCDPPDVQWGKRYGRASISRRAAINPGEKLSIRASFA